MSILHSLVRVSFPVLVAAATLGACGDDEDSTGTDGQSETADGGADEPGSSRAGTTGSTRAGRGGSGGALAGRSGSAGAGSTTTAGRRAAAGSGSAGTAGRRTVPPGSGTAGTGGVVAMVDDAGSAPVVAGLEDGQITELLGSVNTIQVSLGTLAVERALDPEVRNYAQTLVTMHNAAQARQTAVIEALTLMQAPSKLSEAIETEATATRNQLQNATAIQFDFAFVSEQVRLHTQVLEAIDEQLLPSVTAEALRAELVVTRTDVEAHLTEARRLLTTLDGGADADAGIPAP
jgi:putative membrane protein